MAEAKILIVDDDQDIRRLLDLGLPAGDGRVVMERLKAMPALGGSR